MSEVAIYAGQGNGPKLYGLFSTNKDDATDYTLRLENADFYPAGMGNEAIFPVCWLMLSWTMAVTVRVTPILDGVVYDGTGDTTDERLTFAVTAQTDRKTQTFEIPLTRPLLDSVDGVTEIGRLAMRGERIRLRVETTGALGTTGDLIVEGCLLEHEAVVGTLAPAATP